MSLKINIPVSERVLFVLSVLGSAVCGLLFGRLSGLAGLISGVIIGFFLPVSLIIVITGFIRIMRNSGNINLGSLNNLLLDGIKKPAVIWITSGSVIAISSGVFLGLRTGGSGIIVGSLGSFMIYYTLTIVFMRIIKKRF